MDTVFDLLIRKMVYNAPFVCNQYINTGVLNADTNNYNL